VISIVFTHSDKIGSILIRDLTQSQTSHMAWLLDGKLVFHSNHKGCHVEWIKNFLDVNVIIKRIDLDMLTLEEEEKLYLEILKYDGKKYDHGAFWFQGFCWIASKIGFKGRPTVNKWGSKYRYLCLELAKPLEIFGVKFPDLETIIPDDLFYFMKTELKDKLYALD
jgi:hypothetical protein